MSIKQEESLGEIIKRTIKERGLKEAFVADKMGISKQSINQISKRKTFDIEWLQKLKAATGLDFTEYAYPSALRISTPYSTDIEDVSYVEEESEDFFRKIEMSLNIKISTDESQLDKVGELIKQLKKQASKMGFKLS